MRTLASILLPMLLLGCSGGDGIPVYGYDLVRTFPPDPTAFTQGLVFHEGALLESTGIAGLSSLRRVDLETGRILKISPTSGRPTASPASTRRTEKSPAGSTSPASRPRVIRTIGTPS